MPPSWPKGRGGGGICPGRRPSGGRLKAVCGCDFITPRPPGGTRQHHPPMRTRHLLLSLFLTQLGANARAEETQGPSSPATRLVSPITVGKFVPPAPVPPKEIPAMRVESSSTRKFPAHRITVLRGEPSKLADIPRGLPPAPPTAEEIAARQAFAARFPRPVTIQIRARVYDHEKSVVYWHHPEHVDQRYQAVVSLDFGVFVNVGRFVQREATTRERK